MKQQLLIYFICLLSSFAVSAQVTAGQIDDFEDGTTESWFEGSGSYMNMPTDGPAGAGDNYLLDSATGTSGAGGRMAIRNLATWSGDFTSESILAIKMDVRAITNDMTVRVGITGGPSNGGKFCSSTGVLVTAGSGWTSVTIPISSADMVSVSDGSGGGPPGTDIVAALANATEVRIISAVNPAWRGDIILGELHLDNIEASTTLSTPSVTALSDFKMYPNPGTNTINIGMAELNSSTQLEVFDILGKRVLLQNLEMLNTQIDIQEWNSGIYLVKITNDTATQTKRFVKQ